MGVRNYIAIAEPSDDGKTWWISFPGLPGVTSAADRPEQIARQARDALTSAIEAGAVPPPAIEDGVIPAYNLGEYENPLVVLVAYEPAVPHEVADGGPSRSVDVERLNGHRDPWRIERDFA